jgi:hypothetical protein
MTWRARVLRAAISLICLALLAAGFSLVCRKVSSLPFRATNDYLHRQDAPLTLDFLIPGGTYIDERMTIGEVARLRFEKPGRGLDLLVRKMAETIPVRYRLLGTTLFYLFWVLLFFVLLRVFTWARYATALTWSFALGAAVYFFMPDLVPGRIDDAVFIAWAGGFWIGRHWWLRRARARSPRE